MALSSRVESSRIGGGATLRLPDGFRARRRHRAARTHSLATRILTLFGSAAADPGVSLLPTSPLSLFAIVERAPRKQITFAIWLFHRGNVSR